MDKGYQLADLFDKEHFQQMQDNFAIAFDLGFITVDYLGRPMFKYSGFTEFCNRLRKKKECLELCRQCDAHGGIHATITGEPYIYKCHTGLVDFAVPLILEGRYMGSVMGGQAEIIGEAPELERIIPQKYNWRDDPELVDAAKRVRKLTYKKLVASVYLIRDIMQNMMKEEYRRAKDAELEKKDMELREEKALRLSLEEVIEESNAAGFPQSQSSESLFHMLNIVARLAYSENAVKTEQAVYNASSIIRFSTENNANDFVTLGEEIEYTSNYLEIEKLRLDDRLTYDIQVPEEYHSVLCPCMVLSPFVVNAVKHSVERSGSKGVIDINARIEGKFLIVIVSDNGTGMSRRLINTLLELNTQKSGKKSQITRINRLIKNVFGNSFGVSIISREDGFPGTQVQLYLSYDYGGVNSLNQTLGDVLV